MRNLLLTLVLLAAAGAAAQPLEPGYPPLGGDTFLETRLFLEANFARGREGLAPLAIDEGLALAARHHAAEMAALGYFSHASPQADHATLRHRLALAGSPLVTVGENLAMVQGQPDLAAAAVQGWLDSPGHRANLLGEDFSHVGYGTAVTARGATVIVQVLAFKPGTLQRVAVEPRLLTERRIRITVHTGEAVAALVSVAGAADVPIDLEPGSRQIEIVTHVELGAQVQIRSGVALGDGRFTLEDAGWLDTASGVWTSDPSSTRQSLRIEGVELEQSQRGGAHITLAYRLPPGRQLAVFLDGAHQRHAVEPGGLVSLLVAESGYSAPLQIGVLDGNRVEIFHSFVLTTESGLPALQPEIP